MKGRKQAVSPASQIPSPDEVPYRLYTQQEIAKVLNVDVRYVQKARKAGAPFPLGKSRPDWCVNWLLQHANDDKLKESVYA